IRVPRGVCRCPRSTSRDNGGAGISSTTPRGAQSRARAGRDPPAANQDRFSRWSGTTICRHDVVRARTGGLPPSAPATRGIPCRDRGHPRSEFQTEFPRSQVPGLKLGRFRAPPKFQTVHRPWPSDVLKVLLYSAAVVILGATIAPCFYNLGKGLAEVTEHKQTNGIVAWAARLADRSTFADFHNASLVLSAAVLSLPLFGWLRLG